MQIVKKASSTGHRQAGFSLLELLAVLVLLGLLAGISGPAVGSYFKSLDFRRQTGKIMAALQHGRLQAITSGRQVHLQLEEQEGPVLLLSSGSEEPRSYGFELGDRLQLEPQEITFFPEGLATPAEVSFSRGERTSTIRVDPLTGWPRLQ